MTPGVANHVHFTKEKSSLDLRPPNGIKLWLSQPDLTNDYKLGWELRRPQKTPGPIINFTPKNHSLWY